MKHINNILLTIIVAIAGTLSSNAEEKLILSYTIPDSEYIGSLADYQIMPVSGEASNSQPGETIEKSFDGKKTTIYHSSWTATKFPVTLKYNFDNAGQIDYIVYYPRADGANGNFMEFELWYTLQGGERVKYDDFDFKGTSYPSKIVFETALNNPESIEFVVNSGVSDLVSCSEMEFMRSNTESGSFLDLFEDKLATTLKSNVKENDIRNIPNKVLKDVATKIYNKNYSLEYRLGEFKAYLNLKKLGEALIAEAYNKYENPTGIYFPEGKHLIIAENITADKPVYLLIPDFRFLHGGGNILSKSYLLKNGINIIDVEDWDGLGYISYFSDTPKEEQKVKIHFVNAQEHGYFDVTKHTNEDFVKILDNTTSYPVMDMVGRQVQLAFRVEDYKTYTKGKAVELVNAYDSIVTYEHRFLGLLKYKKQPENRVLCRVNYSYFMFKDSDGASFKFDTMDIVANPDRVLKDSWGMGHEIGHIHQIKFVNWPGMGEVSVNFPNLYINFIHPSEKSTNMSRQKAKRAIEAICDKGISHAAYHVGDYNMYKLAPFAILYHYMMVEHGRMDFYADLYERFRNSTEDTTGWNTADYEYYFIKTASEVAQLNLVPFFERWGLLYCTDISGRKPFEVEDYADGYYELSTEKVKSLKEYIATQKYDTPDSNVMMSDRIINRMTNIDN